MWVFKYLICLATKHIWVGSVYKYCLRCGKLEMEAAPQTVSRHAAR